MQSIGPAPRLKLRDVFDIGSPHRLRVWFAFDLERSFPFDEGVRDRAHQTQTDAQVSNLIAHEFNTLVQVVKSALHIIERRERGVSGGLGLSAVKAFAEQCKGHAHIASTPGCGTSVRLIFRPTPKSALASAC
jgi:hypothetical protein